MIKSGNKVRITLEEARQHKGQSNPAKIIAQQKKERQAEKKTPRPTRS